MKFNSLKTLSLASALTLAGAFYACGDDSGSSAADESISSSSEEIASSESNTKPKSNSSEADDAVESSSSEVATESSSSVVNQESSSSEADDAVESSDSETASESSSSDANQESSSSEADDAVESSSSEAAAESSSSAVKPASSSSPQYLVNCAGKTYEAGNHDMTITVDGKERTFIMRVPAAYKGNKPVPLLVDYHQIGGNSTNHMNSSGYKTYSDAIGGITLYPQGTAKTMGPGWNVGPCCSNDDDIKFSREMIKMVEEKVCIDTKRVYAAGYSMGGGMANHVACFMSDVFTAVAPAAMDLNTTNSAQCAPKRAVPIIMFRGTNDNTCRYQGGDSGFNDGLNFLGAEGNFKFWANKNGCTDTPATNMDGCQEYSNCKEGSKVVLCTKQGGGHEFGDASIGWPFLYSFEME